MAEVYQKDIQLDDYSKEDLVTFYREMVKIRKFDENLIRLMHEGKVSGFYHSGIGSEGLSVGSIVKNLRDEDYLYYNHRGCNQKIAKGVPLSKLYGDFLGTVEGTTRGLGAGIVHSADTSRGVLGQAGTIGSQFNIAVGSAYSAKLQNTNRVTVVYFGDGAASREPLHGSLNWAGLYNLPIIYICENNEYAISSRWDETHSVREHIADWAWGYGISNCVVDGNDVLLMNEVTKEAVDRAKRGEGPTFIEAKTFRHRGHFEGDTYDYVDQEELKDWKENRDPIKNFKNLLLENNICVENEFTRVDEEVDQEILEAIAKAESSPMPDEKRIYEGLFA
ncbi:thiamine pyrophosphate-dependent dehydrogenase E1 component subunit alpha [Salinibacillus xinjiangensis]|uniref:Pyruvate dehydrogenase (Acetyl-transferring) E1 component subunit alpha n=1 Tax=Salinibacillus xinjiangensis TaxID=1229268 RepID=A0A6G1X2V8_9BACI|nr:thiamine pyrophosphate-dependent dehydrogenase E1 component subunit alpha [Salinibacillus xinjiangensis]MRG85235.1 pyruvate dehydrogenase (acetyl-transferring) E1 component subunit alpha [Salinibacillus xinjiangensis]